MAEEKTLASQTNTEYLAKIGRDLAAAFEELTAEWKRDAKQRTEAMEVAALFQLYRAERGSGPAEVRARIRAAIAGYDTAYLADLITFGERLHQEARPVWEGRAR